MAMALGQIGQGTTPTGVAPWQTDVTGALLETRPRLQVALRQQHSMVIFHLQESKQQWLKWNQTKKRGPCWNRTFFESATFGGAETSLMADAFAAVCSIARLWLRTKVDLIYVDYKVLQGHLVSALESVRFSLNPNLLLHVFIWLIFRKGWFCSCHGS